jgi:hypothetical protein
MVTFVTLDTLAANFGNIANRSLTSNGYMYMPNGGLLQWATLNSANTVSQPMQYPIPFNTAPFVVLAMAGFDGAYAQFGNTTGCNVVCGVSAAPLTILAWGH